MISSRYGTCSSSSWSTCSILVLSNVLFLCQISVTFVSCTQRSGLRSFHILVFSYHIIFVRIAFLSIPVMCEAGSPVNRLKVVSRLCRIRSFFAVLSSLIHLTIMRYECSFAPARISLFSKFATVGTGHKPDTCNIVQFRFCIKKIEGRRRMKHFPSVIIPILLQKFNNSTAMAFVHEKSFIHIKFNPI